MPDQETFCKSCDKRTSVITNYQTIAQNLHTGTLTNSKADHIVASLSTSSERAKGSIGTDHATVPVSIEPKTYHTVPIDIAEKEDEEERRRRIAMLDPEFSAPDEEQSSSRVIPRHLVADLTTRENIPQVSGTSQIDGQSQAQGTPQFGGGTAWQGTPPQPYAHFAPSSGMSQNVGPTDDYISPAQHGWLPPDTPYPLSMPSTSPQYLTGGQTSSRSHSLITWLRIGLIAVLVLLILIFSAMGLSLLASTPTLTLTGGTNVVQGSILHLNGSHFLPDSTVTLTLDHTTPIYYSYQQPYSPTKPETISNNINMAEAWILEKQLTQASLVNDKIKVGSNGTFSVNIQVGTDWAIGQHTIQAAETSGSRSVTLSFSIIQQTPILTQETVTPTAIAPPTPTATDPAPPVTPATPTSIPTVGITPTVIVTSLSGVTPNALTLGPTNEGDKQAVPSPITLNTTGTALLTWNATWDQQQAPWLQLTPTSGQIQAPASQKITVSAQPATLKAGTYKALITFTNSLNAHIVLLTVALTVQAGCLKVTPTSLNFVGTVGAKDPASQTVTLNNCGLAGTWTATAKANGNWLNINPGSGSIDQNGTQAVTVAVAIASQKLAAGPYQGQILFSSGNNQVTVSVTLTVQSPPQLNVNQQQIAVAQMCKSSAGAWTCNETLSSSGTQGNLAWTASSSETGGVTITPASGTIAAGQTMSVTIAIPIASCATNFTLTFTGLTNSVNVPVDCSGT